MSQPYAPPAPKPKTRRDFWLRGPGIILLFIAAGILIGVPLALLGVTTDSGGSSPAGSGFAVKATSCEMDETAAVVGLQVTNTQDRTDSVRIDVEYRDGAGRRLDTDTAWIRDVAPGDTVAHEETTLLNATPSGTGSCEITAVR